MYPLTAVDFKLLFESTPSLNMELMPDFTISMVSDRYLEATMTQRESITGRKLFDVFPDSTTDKLTTGFSNLRASLNLVLKDGLPHILPEQKYILNRGEFPLVENYWSTVNTPVFKPKNKSLLSFTSWKKLEISITPLPRTSKAI